MWLTAVILSVLHWRQGVIHMKLKCWISWVGLLCFLDSTAYGQQYPYRRAYGPRTVAQYQQHLAALKAAADAKAAAAAEASETPAQTVPQNNPPTRKTQPNAATPAQGYGGGGNNGGGYGGNSSPVLVPRVYMAGNGGTQGGAQGGANANGTSGNVQGSGGVSYVTNPTLRMRSQTVARQFFIGGGIRFAPTAPNGYNP
jgi:hypothetical protein